MRAAIFYWLEQSLHFETKIMVNYAIATWSVNVSLLSLY